jgi:hypothetical protein
LAPSEVVPRSATVFVDELDPAALNVYTANSQAYDFSKRNWVRFAKFRPNAGTSRLLRAFAPLCEPHSRSSTILADKLELRFVYDWDKFAWFGLLVAADESEVFAGYLPYRTWDPRPVAGSAGLVPTTWSASFDQWGAVQLQSRFSKKFKRPMRPLDAQVWTAVRMIGEASSRIESAETASLVAYIKSADFSVAAFKGQKLTIRDWNFQLRQPILLSDGRNIVSVSPQEAFLHPVSALDTLGADKAETRCKLN